MLNKTLISGICFLIFGFSEEGFSQETEDAGSTQVVIEDYSDKTLLFDSAHTGYGVQYFGLDGRTYLWFPGQMNIASGTWSDRRSYLKTGSSESSTDDQGFEIRNLCFEFPGQPRAQFVTESFGPSKCFHVLDYVLAVQEVANGDVLNLSSGQTPCRICPTDKTLSQLTK